MSCRRSRPSRWGPPALFALVLALGAQTLGCFDPIHADAVAELGGEAQGVRTGPNHRPGQPCLVCHGGDGPGPDFEMAGTVYETRAGTAAAAGVTVRLTDAKGIPMEARTNQVGNFYIEGDRWSPTYPVRVELTRGGTPNKMETRIGRQTGCASCHQKAGSTTIAPLVYFSEAP